MKNDEVNDPHHTSCAKCDDTGILTLKEQLQPHVGKFCDCEAGKARWDVMIKAMEEFERPTERLVGERRFDPSARRVEQLLSTI